MDNLVRLTNKEFAYSCIELLNAKSHLKKEELKILTNEDDCKMLFNCSKFSILSEVKLEGELGYSDCYDENAKQRYYKEKIYADDRAFIVSNHWYGPNKSMPDNRTPFLLWVLEKIGDDIL